MNPQKPMKISTILLIAIIFFMILAGIRVTWLKYKEIPPHPSVTEGMIDLSAWSFSNNQTVPLDGDWSFYPYTFIQPEEPLEDFEDTHSFIKVPDAWGETLNHNNSNIGYGTYVLEIKLPKDGEYGLKFNDVMAVADIYVNGDKVISSPNTSEFKTLIKESTIGSNTANFFIEGQIATIIIQVRNNDVPYKGGIGSSVKIGTEEAILKEAYQFKTMQIIISTIFILHALYAFIVFIIGKGRFQKELIYFAMFLTISALAILIDDEIVLYLPLTIIWYYKLLLFLFLTTLYILLLFITKLFNIQSYFFTALSWLYLLIIILCFILPFTYFGYLFIAVILFYISSYIYLYTYTIKSIRRGHPDAIWILLFLVSYTSNVIWGYGIKVDMIQLTYYPFDFLFSIILVGIILIKTYARTLQQVEQQAEMLKQADKEKDNFLVATSHEIRNPLHGIINIAQSMLDNDMNNFTYKQRKNISLLLDIGKNMNATLNDLSILTQLQENGIELQRKPVSIATISEMIIDLLEYMKEGKNITLESRIPFDSPVVYADENRLIQIIFNLVHNAIKYTHEGSIVVDADFSDDKATIYVKDTGEGIPEEYLNTIFQSYHRLQQHLSTSSGIGIGLKIVKELVKLHDGEISVQSSKKGTSFAFTLPLFFHHSDNSTILQRLENKSSATIITPTPDNFISDEEGFSPQEEIRILIVDDDPVNLQVLSQILSKLYHITSALNGKEALIKIKENQFDLVISDIMMPGMTGFELTEQIRKQYTLTELPILLMTARDLPKDIYYAFHSGANDYLVKPIHALELKSRVKSLADVKRSVKEALKMESAWLQAQIQPHFLFNTLNSIASLAFIDSDRMVSLIEAFGQYLEKSFSIANVETTIPISEAIKLTAAYVHIEKERFGNRIQVDFDIDENIDISIPPLIIQPLVENAINHGILVKSDGGKVVLKMKKYKEYVDIIIMDNGVGMTEEKITELLDLNYTSGKGIGVKNTNRRLVQTYGQGLRITSKIDKGTIVSFEIPILNE